MRYDPYVKAKPHVPNVNWDEIFEDHWHRQRIDRLEREYFDKAADRTPKEA